MSQAFPIADRLEDALAKDAPVARTLADAARVAGGRRVCGLETSWLHLASEDADRLFESGEPDGAHGHIQRYEDTAGHVVVAVSWWKLTDPGAAGQVASAPPESAPKSIGSDHTDDLYFRRGRTKPKRRKVADPNQLDLFASKPPET